MLCLLRLRTQSSASSTTPSATSTIGTAIAACVPEDIPLEFCSMVDALAGALVPVAVAADECVLLCAPPATGVDIDANDVAARPVVPLLAADEATSTLR